MPRQPELYFQDQIVTLDGLRAALGKLPPSRIKPTLLVKPDKDVPVETIASLLDAAGPRFNYEIATQPNERRHLALSHGGLHPAAGTKARSPAAAPSGHDLLSQPITEIHPLALIEPWISFVPQQQRRLGLFICLALAIHAAICLFLIIDTSVAQMQHAPHLNVSVENPMALAVNGQRPDKFWDEITDPPRVPPAAHFHRRHSVAHANDDHRLRCAARARAA